MAATLIAFVAHACPNMEPDEIPVVEANWLPHETRCILTFWKVDPLVW